MEGKVAFQWRSHDNIDHLKHVVKVRITGGVGGCLGSPAPIHDVMRRAFHLCVFFFKIVFKTII
jgi:hypothetical protein